MKKLHRRDLYCWSAFEERIDIDFNGTAWIRESGNVLVDPLPMSAHDLGHLESLGGAASIVITNSRHVRGAKELAARFGARLLGPAAERETFPVPCDEWLGWGDQPFPGMLAIALDGSKTPGELALLLEETTLITGDLIRAHRAGELMLLRPDQGLSDARAAASSVRGLLTHGRIETVLVGDGWHLFHEGHRRLAELAATLG